MLKSYHMTGECSTTEQHLCLSSNFLVFLVLSLASISAFLKQLWKKLDNIPFPLETFRQLRTITMASLTGSPTGYNTSTPFLLSYHSYIGYNLAQENTRSQWRVKVLSGGKQGRTASQYVIKTEYWLIIKMMPTGNGWQWHVSLLIGH